MAGGDPPGGGPATARPVVVLEECANPRNLHGALRTCAALALPQLWTVAAEGAKAYSGRNPYGDPADLAELQAAVEVVPFASTGECLAALRREGYTIWATDLSQRAVPLDSPALAAPARLAVVFGAEGQGITPEMADGGDLRVYLPLHGFQESLNLSVAVALVMDRILELPAEAGHERGERIPGRRPAPAPPAPPVRTGPGRGRQKESGDSGARSPDLLHAKQALFH